MKTGDTLEIGKRTLAFVQTPMVHWPDSMVTYDELDGILFSNDAFGQHYASFEALRRRGGAARGARSGAEVLRQHRHALR